MDKFPATTAAFIYLTIAAASPAAASIDQPSPTGVGGDWNLIFSDEFDGAAIDKSRWTTCYWWDDGGCTNLGNKELQWYLPDNVRLVDGNLQLEARRERVKGHKDQWFDYTSGMVTTGRDYAEREGPSRAAFKFGYFEIRAKIPSGKGFWPAIWLLPDTHKSTPEIDIMEALGQSANQLRMHVHFFGDDGKKTNKGRTTEVEDMSRDWHVFGLNWTPDSVTWYLDGVEKWKFEEKKFVPNEPMYLIMNLAVGGEWPGPPDDSTEFPSRFLVDYVRVWQKSPP